MKNKAIIEKKKGLSNNILELIKTANQTNDISLLKDIYETREINACDRYGDTALHINSLPMEMVKWLVNQGADINLRDKNGRTPLCYQAPYPDRIKDFLNIGAKIDEDTFLIICKEALKKYPGRVEAIKLFIDHGVTITDEMASLIDKINKPMKLKEKIWEKEFHELWESLVPDRGVAETIQGEVIRIVGKVGHEILDNGGQNWNIEFSKMLQALLKYFSKGIPLSKEDIIIALDAKKQLKNGTCNEEAIERLAEMAVKWVLTNSIPIKLES
jgi:hypothetical protein